MDDKGRVSMDSLPEGVEIKDESTVTQDDRKPVPIFDAMPEHTPEEGFFLIRLKDSE